MEGIRPNWSSRSDWSPGLTADLLIIGVPVYGSAAGPILSSPSCRTARGHLTRTLESDGSTTAWAAFRGPRGRGAASGWGAVCRSCGFSDQRVEVVIAAESKGEGPHSLEKPNDPVVRPVVCRLEGGLEVSPIHREGFGGMLLAAGGGQTRGPHHDSRPPMPGFATSDQDTALCPSVTGGFPTILVLDDPPRGEPLMWVVASSRPTGSSTRRRQGRSARPTTSGSFPAADHDRDGVGGPRAPVTTLEQLR